MHVSAFFSNASVSSSLSDGSEKLCAFAKNSLVFFLLL